MGVYTLCGYTEDGGWEETNWGCKIKGTGFGGPVELGRGTFIADCNSHLQYWQQCMCYE